MIYVWPYKLGSRSAAALAQRLICKRISGDKRVRSYSHVLNWGSGNDVEILQQRTLRILNNPEAVNKAKNKLTTLIVLSQAGVSVPEWTSERHVANSWRDEDTVVYARTMLESHSGRGIVIVKAEDNIVHAPLYVKGITRVHEYRVHVGSGAIIDFAKKRRRDGGNHNEFIKNLDNGWVFCRDNVSLPSEVVYQAVKAVEALGLDFGAVDVLYREASNKAYVLEVNTAPGLEGTTLERYVEYFRGIV